MILSKTFHSMKVFLVIWLGQMISLIGSGLTGFALGVWVYQRTGSTTQFALIALFTTFPGTLLSPFTGVLADRWDRRQVMLFSNVGAALITLLIALLLWTNQLHILLVYVTMTAISLCSALLLPAYNASVSVLVPKEYLGRASGMVQTAEATAQIGAPILAGMLIIFVGLPGILLLDFLTYLVAIATLLFVRFSWPGQTNENSTKKRSIFQEARFGWQYIRERTGILELLLFFAATNTIIGMLQILVTPLVLSFSSPAALGTIFSVAGIGMLAGGLVMGIWGGPKRRVSGIYIFALIQGVFLCLGGLRSNSVLIGISVFVILFGSQILRGCGATILRSQIPHEVQGRVFGLNQLIGWSTLPLAYLIAGPLADKVFNPLLVPGGALAGSVGQFIGVGTGRGIGFLLLILGGIYIVITAINYIIPNLRHVEDQVLEPQIK